MSVMCSHGVDCETASLAFEKLFVKQYDQHRACKLSVLLIEKQTLKHKHDLPALTSAARGYL